jgi:glycosyltransferase involved in cell wall biosynthesis
MDIHKNARATPRSRAAIVERITQLGESITGVARAVGVCHKAVRKWLARARAFVRRTFGVPDARLTVIANAVDTTRFRPLPGERYADRALFVGRLEPQKNVLALVEAVEGTGIALDVVGGGSLRPDVEPWIAARDVAVRLLPRIPNHELPALMSHYPVFVLPSLYEGNPKALLEAMSCGMAVVAAAVEGIREIIRDGVNGVLCGTEARSIRAALRAVFDDPAERARLGARTHTHVIVYHELEEIVRQEIDLYHDLLVRAL